MIDGKTPKKVWSKSNQDFKEGWSTCLERGNNGCETGCGYVVMNKGKEGCQGKDGEESWWIAKIVEDWWWNMGCV